MTSIIAEASVKSPYAVRIAPNMGELKVKEQVRLKNIGPNLYAFNIFLPASVSVQNGFSVSVPGFAVSSVSRKLLLPGDEKDGTERARLVQELREARREQARLEGLERALDSRLALWNRQTQGQDLNVMPQAKDLEDVDAAMGVKLPEIYAQKAELPEQKQKNNELLAYLQNELNALGGERPQLAEVTITLTGIVPQSAASAAASALAAEYSYFSYNCGWWPSYSFEADPVRGTVLFKQQANIRQNSGQDWNGVELSLGTKALDFKTKPGDLGNWYLYREEPPRPAAAMRNMEFAAMAPAPTQDMAEAKVANRPVSMELGTHREWSIGKVNLVSGTPAAIELEQQSWKGDFYYTLRPSLDEYGYLTALVELDKPVELPRGAALFLVDNRLAGYLENFSANSNELYLYFGKDNMVSVEMRDVLSMKGQEKFILKTNTYNWEWEIIAKNMRNRPVKVRVEDAIPQPRDASIKLKVESAPKPEEKRNYYYWEKEIPPAGEFIINHKIEAKASGSEPIISGR